MKNYIRTTLIYQIVSIAAIATLISCGPSEKDQLRSKLDSLQQELTTSQQLADQLNEVGALMDSIDASRNSLRLNMVEGSQQDYTARMKQLNEYVLNTQTKIEELEKSLKSSKSKNASYAATVKRLKADIEARNLEIAELKLTVDKYAEENRNLVATTETQALDIAQKQEQIESNRRDISNLDQRIVEISANAKATEAAGYLARAVAVEESAKRTKLAPRKKRATLNESLALYRKAVELGNDDAKSGIQRLEAGLK